ncbi:hypothetical protein [Streptomyces violascens]|uniref:hypothetical protein n=1 Tax=Streptomyces violascens TaxID=67381 RepID=UPI00167AD23A|nr:hypothetical protein [Streptomyces violascens]GGU38953.1 hypothetical protein GCM10010289_69790 [Streptomyces violascens]
MLKHTELHDARELTHMDKERVGMLWKVEIYPFRTEEKLRLLDELLYGSERAPE